LGWLEYRLGEIKKAEEILRKAYNINSDAEIAAHLGEVLWRLNQKSEAKKILKEAIKKYPKSKSLKKMITRLNINL
jgi:TolA-binding protein